MERDDMDILGQGLVCDNFKCLQIRQDVLEEEEEEFAQTHTRVESTLFCRTDDEICPGSPICVKLPPCRAYLSLRVFQDVGYHERLYSSEGGERFKIERSAQEECRDAPARSASFARAASEQETEQSSQSVTIRPATKRRFQACLQVP